MVGEAKTRLHPAAHVAILLAALLPRVWAAFADQGLFWPDEFYQSIEQAHRFAFGYGLVPWEWVQGVRSWVYPGFLGLLWKVLAALGATRAETFVISAKLVSVVLAVLGVEASIRLGQRLAGAKAAALAGVLVALFPAMVLFGSKCMTETVSAPMVVIAGLLFLPSGTRTSSIRRAALAGVMLGLAVFCRYQNGIIVAGFMLLLWTERRWKDSLGYAAGLAAIGAFGGGLDWIIWGVPLHSFIAYARFHAETGAAAGGTDPFAYYFVTTWRSAGVVTALVALGLIAATPKYWREVAVCALYVVVHSLVPHKEYRYITPIVPFMLTYAAVGIVQLVRWVRKRLLRGTSTPWRLFDRAFVPALCVASAVLFTERTVDFTFADLGHPDGLAAELAGPQDSPWHAAEGINRMLWKAGEEPDTCGVLVKDIPWSSTGGYAYLHRDVPLMFKASPAAFAAANYIVARREWHQPPEYSEGPESEGFMLFHRDGGCSTPPPDYTRFVPR